MRKISWLKVLYATIALTVIVCCHVFTTHQFFKLMWLILLVFPVWAILMEITDNSILSKSELNTVKYMPMSMFYKKTHREDADAVLAFNEALCNYCLYDGDYGVIIQLNFDDLASMDFAQNEVAKMIIARMKSMNNGADEGYFFIQNNISPFSF
jgi:hypothetical protein